MATIQHAPSTSADICNAESTPTSTRFSLESCLTAWLQKHRDNLSNINHRAGLHKDSPDRYTRERWEIVAGKIMVIDDLMHELHHVLADIPENLTGRKPILEAMRIERAVYVKTLREIDERALSEEYKRTEWNRADEVVTVLTRLLRLSGNAGEQPETSEEDWLPYVNPAAVSPTPFGGIDETAVAKMLSVLPVPALRSLVDAALAITRSRS